MNIIELNLNQAEDKIEFDSILYNLYYDFDYIDQHNAIYFNTLITAFVLKINNAVEARIALFKSKDDHIKYFGHFEALNVESGIEILNYVISYIKKNNINTQIIGPINGLTWFPYRLATNNDHSLFKNDLCNPIYYNDIMNTCGMIVKETYCTNIQTNFNSNYIHNQSEFIVKTLSHDELKNRGNEIYNITMKAFKHSPFFIPIPYEVFEVQYQKQLFQINHELSPFILDSEGNICAYSSCYESNNGDGIVVKTIARKLDRKYAGIGRILSEEISNIATQRNYNYLLHAFMHQNNSSKSLSEKFNGVPLKSYALYQYL